MAVSLTPRLKVILVLAAVGFYYYMWGIPDFIMSYFRDRKPEEIYIEAAERGNVQKVKDLLAAGVPVDTVGFSLELFDIDYKSRARDGDTALLIAAKCNHGELVKLLLKKKANVNARNSISGETALIGAAKFGNVEVVQTLLQNRANPNLTTNVGFTALMEACRSDKLKTPEMMKVVQALIDGKADVHHKNKRKQTARNLCKDVSVVAILEKAGAKE